MWLLKRLEELLQQAERRRQEKTEDDKANQRHGPLGKNATNLREMLDKVRNFVPRLPKISASKLHHPNRQKLSSVQDFFLYTEAEGRKLFSELDRDGDGLVTLEDLEAAMRRRKLPQRYAREVLRRLRRGWFAKSFGWSEFQSLMERCEPSMLRAYTSMEVSESGTLQKGQVLKSLRKAGLAATDDNAAAMMRYLGVDSDGHVGYGQFRSFMLLLPPERLGDDPSMLWFQAATVVPMAPPVATPAGSVIKSALAGGLACGLSTTIMHPLDTLKTRVQVSTKTFSQVFAEVPQLGARGLYRGSIPAIIGQFSSHGLRTGIYEATKLLLHKVAPDLPDVQVQSLSSLGSTFLGTGLRIPCEVVKQRLQAGMHVNVREAVASTFRENGVGGFFRGTTATLCREVPFYVVGMVLYEEAKKAARSTLDRELVAWETLLVGALSGGTAAFCTTPFDVLKTRLMTAAPGAQVSMASIALSTVQKEGVQALFKGAVPRFFWIAPLGAMNFAGYELAKRALEKKEREAREAERRAMAGEASTGPRQLEGGGDLAKELLHSQQGAEKGSGGGWALVQGLGGRSRRDNSESGRLPSTKVEVPEGHVDGVQASAGGGGVSSLSSSSSSSSSSSDGLTSTPRGGKVLEMREKILGNARMVMGGSPSAKMLERGPSLGEEASEGGAGPGLEEERGASALANDFGSKDNVGGFTAESVFNMGEALLEKTRIAIGSGIASNKELNKVEDDGVAAAADGGEASSQGREPLVQMQEKRREGKSPSGSLAEGAKVLGKKNVEVITDLTKSESSERPINFPSIKW